MAAADGAEAVQRGTWRTTLGRGLDELAPYIAAASDALHRLREPAAAAGAPVGAAPVEPARENALFLAQESLHAALLAVHDDDARTRRLCDIVALAFGRLTNTLVSEVAASAVQHGIQFILEVACGGAARLLQSPYLVRPNVVWYGVYALPAAQSRRNDALVFEALHDSARLRAVWVTNVYRLAPADAGARRPPGPRYAFPGADNMHAALLDARRSAEWLELRAGPFPAPDSDAPRPYWHIGAALRSAVHIPAAHAAEDAATIDNAVTNALGHAARPEYMARRLMQRRQPLVLLDDAGPRAVHRMFATEARGVLFRVRAGAAHTPTDYYSTIAEAYCALLAAVRNNGAHDQQQLVYPDDSTGWTHAMMAVLAGYYTENRDAWEALRGLEVFDIHVRRARASCITRVQFVVRAGSPLGAVWINTNAMGTLLAHGARHVSDDAAVAFRFAGQAAIQHDVQAHLNFGQPHHPAVLTAASTPGASDTLLSVVVGVGRLLGFTLFPFDAPFSALPVAMAAAVPGARSVGERVDAWFKYLEGATCDGATGSFPVFVLAGEVLWPLQVDTVRVDGADPVDAERATFTISITVLSVLSKIAMTDVPPFNFLRALFTALRARALLTDPFLDGALVYPEGSPPQQRWIWMYAPAPRRIASAWTSYVTASYRSLCGFDAQLPLGTFDHTPAPGHFRRAVRRALAPEHRSRAGDAALVASVSGLLLGVNNTALQTHERPPLELLGAAADGYGGAAAERFVFVVLQHSDGVIAVAFDGGRGFIAIYHNAATSGFTYNGFIRDAIGLLTSPAGGLHLVEDLLALWVAHTAAIVPPTECIALLVSSLGLGAVVSITSPAGAWAHHTGGVSAAHRNAARVATAGPDARYTLTASLGGGYHGVVAGAPQRTAALLRCWPPPAGVHWLWATTMDVPHAAASAAASVYYCRGIQRVVAWLPRRPVAAPPPGAHVSDMSAAGERGAPWWVVPATPTTHAGGGALQLRAVLMPRHPLRATAFPSDAPSYVIAATPGAAWGAFEGALEVPSRPRGLARVPSAVAAVPISVGARFERFVWEVVLGVTLLAVRADLSADDVVGQASVALRFNRETTSRHVLWAMPRVGGDHWRSLRAALWTYVHDVLIPQLVEFPTARGVLLCGVMSHSARPAAADAAAAAAADADAVARRFAAAPHATAFGQVLFVPPNSVELVAGGVRLKLASEVETLPLPAACVSWHLRTPGADVNLGVHGTLLARDVVSPHIDWRDIFARVRYYTCACCPATRAHDETSACREASTVSDSYVYPALPLTPPVAALMHVAFTLAADGSTVTLRAATLRVIRDGIHTRAAFEYTIHDGAVADDNHMPLPLACLSWHATLTRAPETLATLAVGLVTLRLRDIPPRGPLTLRVTYFACACGGVGRHTRGAACAGVRAIHEVPVTARDGRPV